MRSVGYSIVSGQTLVSLDSECEVLSTLLIPMFLSPHGRDGRAYCLNINHGRSVYVGQHQLPCLGKDKRHVFAKGVGLTLGTTPYLFLPKHGGTYYGLCEKDEGMREWKHSLGLSDLGLNTGSVLGVVQIEEIPDWWFSTSAERKCPPPVEACIIYSATRSLYRLSDLAYLSESDRGDLIQSYELELGVHGAYNFILKLVSIIAENAARLHEFGGYNRTIYAHNLTCLGEVVDFEAIRVPVRRRKNQAATVVMMQRLEIYNSIEVLANVADLLRVDWNVSKITHIFAEVYMTYTTQRAALNAVISEKIWNSV